MKKLGLKASLIVSIVLLVGVSVATSGLLSYLEHADTLTDSIETQSRIYVENRAAIIEGILNDKVEGIDKLTDQLKTISASSSSYEVVEMAKLIANVTNTGSSVIAFNNGDGYWSHTGASWPDHKYDGDVTERPWYKEAMQASGVTVTEPYLGTDGVYWVTIVDKINDGALSVDMKLTFLNALVEPSKNMKGTVAVILNSDTTLLASSSSAIPTGKSANQYSWFRDAAQHAVTGDYVVSEYVLNGEEKLLFSKKIRVGDKSWFYAIGVSKSIAYASLSSSRNSAIVSTLVATIVSATVAILLIRWLYTPIISLRNTIQELSSGNGDLTQRLEVKTEDDIGNISSGVNTFIANLQTMMLDVKSASEELQHNIANLREQSAENSATLGRHVTETEQIATAVEQMDVTANSMALDASNTASITEQASQTSDESKTIVRRSEETVSALITDVNNAADDVQAMSEQVNSISSILTVIGEVAEQTNLLALNAAIEAARAGDMGRGFAVVADEVRELASRTTMSTREIEQAINILLERCNKVEQSMAETRSRCEETASGSQEVANSLDSLTDFVSNIDALSGQIATAAEEQSCVTKDVSRNMTAISDIVATLNQHGEKVLHEAENISSINNKLITVVNNFKL